MTIDRPNNIKASKNENQAACNWGMKPKTHMEEPVSNNPTFKKLRLDIIKINGYANKETTKKKRNIGLRKCFNETAREN
jgi:hypothetical protein